MTKPDIHFSPGFFLLLALLLLVIPVQWIGASMLAAVFHEMCHYFALRLLGGPPSSLQLAHAGARISLPEISRGRELLCALAGPMGGLLLLLLGRWLPRTAFCAGLQSLYNLLPIYPLDGGRAVQCILSMGLSPPKAAAIANFLSGVCRLGLLAVSIYACLVLKLGLLPMLFCLLLLIRLK